MQFKSLKNIESSFRQLRLFGIVYLCACTLLVGYSVWKAYRFAEAQRQKIYVLDEGKSLMLALAQDLSQNRPVEAREHVKCFHELFFSLAPRQERHRGKHTARPVPCRPLGIRPLPRPCRAGVLQPCHIGQYHTQRIEIDSVKCDLHSYPYDVVAYSRLSIIREKSVTERSLVTRGRLINSTRSDNNPHGFILESFRVVENRDLRVSDR